MKRYLFSDGRVTVEDGIDLRPEKRHHPLRSSPIWIRIPTEIQKALEALDHSTEEDGNNGRHEVKQQR